MYYSFIAAALAALLGRAVAQSADFVNMTWAPVTVGSMWPITWSEGNGQPVTLALSNATWSYTIVENQAATPGMYDWTITVPDGFAEGNYQLSIAQAGAGTSTSPIFAVSFSTLPPMSSSSAAASISPTMASTMSTMMTPNATVVVSPTITVVCPVIWWDDECSCTKTTTSPVVMPTPTSAQYVWQDSECGCHKTAIVPTATMASNYTAPMSTPQMPPAGSPMANPAATGPAGWTGAASNIRLSGSTFAAMVLIGAAFAL